MASVQSHHVLSHIYSECILTRTASSYLYSFANCMIIGFDRAKMKLPGLLMIKHPNLTHSLNYFLSNWCYRLNIATAVSVQAGDDTFDISSSSLCIWIYKHRILMKCSFVSSAEQKPKAHFPWVEHISSWFDVLLMN